MLLSVLSACANVEDHPAQTDAPVTDAPPTPAPQIMTPEPTAEAETFAPIPGKTIALCGGLVLAVKEDGTVLADDAEGWRDISGFSEWKDVVSVASNGRLAVGVTSGGGIRTLIFADDPEAYKPYAEELDRAAEELMKVTDAVSVDLCKDSAAVVHRDGTVTFAPISGEDVPDLSDWTDIIQAAVTGSMIYGLRADGTVLARTRHSHDLDTTKDWTGVKYIDAEGGTCIAVLEDGSAVSDWQNDDTYEKGLSGWEDIVSVSRREMNVLGLKKDGTVELFSYYNAVQGEVIYELGFDADRLAGTEEWTDVVSIEYDFDRAIGLKKDGTLVTAGLFGSELMDALEWQGITAFSAAEDHIVGLRADGTVAAVGANDLGQCDVSGWKDIIAVSAAFGYTAGLKKDGTVVVTHDGRQPIAQLSLEVKDWRGVTAISAGKKILVGLTKNGVVLIAGTVSDTDNVYSGPGQTAMLDGFTGISFISGGSEYAVCIRNNGRAQAAGSGPRGKYDFSSWSGLRAVSMKGSVCLGLKNDGTVLLGGAPRPYADESFYPTGAGAFTDYVARISEWTGIKAVAAGEYAFAGLKKDGTVCAEWMNEYMVRDVSGWTDIVAVDCAGCSVIALRSDGTVVAAGLTGFRECPVFYWSGIRLP